MGAFDLLEHRRHSVPLLLILACRDRLQTEGDADP
jgi:hypothetical protein